MSLKQDRTGTRTAEDLRRRINVKAIDETVEKSEENIETVVELNKHVDNLNNSVNNTRLEYVSTLNQTFTEEQKTRARNNIGAGNSSFSGSYEDLTNTPKNISAFENDVGYLTEAPTKISELENDSDFVEDANYIHTDNNYTDEEKEKLNGIEEGAQVNVLEKIYVAGEEITPTNKAVNLYVDSSMSDYSENPVQNKAIKQYIDDNLSPATTYFASSYAESGVSILRSSIEVKNNRVCFNFVGTKSMAANTTTTLFTLSSELRPIETRDFVVFGQSSNTDGYVGYGYITPDGLLQVRFNEAISSYIRFTAVYDIY